MNHSPAYILVQYLVDEGEGVEPGSSGDWPIFCATLPDGDKVAHSAIGIFDTAGVKDGRLMTGPVLVHRGLQILVRSDDYLTGYQKASSLADLLSDIDGDSVTIGSDAYTLHNITQTTDVVALGQEEGTKRRWLFSVNFLATIQED